MKHIGLPFLLCLVLMAAACSGKSSVDGAPSADAPIKLINLKNAKLLDSKTIDQIPGIPGSETTLRAYLLDKKQIITFTLQNGKTYAFGVREPKQAEHFFADRNADGTFEECGPEFFIDKHTYGY